MGKRIATFAGAVLAASSLFVATATATPSTITKIITPNDLDNTSSNPAVVRADGLNKWFEYNDSNDTVDNTLGNFVYGPGDPVDGQGSVQFTLGSTPNDRKNIATYQFAGQKLAALTQLKYVAYSHSGVAGANESPFLNFNVDFSGTGTNWQRRLVYVPSANMATVPQDTWNTYDTLNGGNALWTWSGLSKGADGISGTSDDNQWPDGNTNTYRTLSDLLAAFPNIRVLPTDSWFGVRVGEPGPNGYTGNVDSITLGTSAGTTVYDFEPTNQPDRAKDCKNNGWQAFNAPVFTSQKACEKWVEASVHGTFRMANPNQKIRLDVSNTTRDNHDWDRHNRGHDDHRKRQNTVEYWNFDYTDVNGQDLHYKTSALCQNINPVTNSARVLFQIPAGHGGLSGLYIVIEVKDGAKNSPATYAQAVAPDLATGTQWCETGVGFSPSYYTVTKDRLEIE